MKIKVEATYGTKPGFRLTMPDGTREQLSGHEWTRAKATEALNLLENVYGYSRSSIRFDVTHA